MATDDIFIPCGDPNCENCRQFKAENVDPPRFVGAMRMPPSFAGDSILFQDLANIFSGRKGMMEEAAKSSGVDEEGYRAWLKSMRASERVFGGEPAQPVQDSAEWIRARAEVEKFLLKVDPQTAWDEIVGNDAARAALFEAIEEPVKSAELYAAYGKKPLKGVLLYGPPGCGKTMFGKAAAAAVGRLYGAAAELVKINATEIQSVYVGETEGRIRAIFRFARLYAERNGHPLTIFIDEADALLPSREGRIMQYQIANVSTFLAEMDGIEGSGAFVILATNRPEDIDPALLRDGRCDRKIKVERPTLAAATEILRKALQGAPVSKSVALDHAAVAADFFAPTHVVASAYIDSGKRRMVPVNLTLADIVNGAMLVGLVERAKGIAMRRDIAAGTLSGIMAEDLREAVRETAIENAGLSHAAAWQDAAARTLATVNKQNLQ